MKNVITMTSWTGRIAYVGKAIYRFINTQTVKPDEFYLWLAEEEFPNKEENLPEDLLIICKHYNVKIKWLKENEYCFKRWYIFPEHYNDMVFSIDDDQIYDNDLIEKVNKRYNELKIPCVISFQCPVLTTISGIEYGCARNNNWKLVTPTAMFLGQCAFAPKSFPLETLKPEIVELRKKYCPKCDESILHPFLINNDIPIVYCENKQKMSEIRNLQSNGLIQEMQFSKININGKLYKRTSILKYLVLHVFPFLQNKWLHYFPKYKMNLLNLTIDQIKEHV